MQVIKPFLSMNKMSRRFRLPHQHSPCSLILKLQCACLRNGTNKQAFLPHRTSGLLCQYLRWLCCRRQEDHCLDSSGGTAPEPIPCLWADAPCIPTVYLEREKQVWEAPPRICSRAGTQRQSAQLPRPSKRKAGNVRGATGSDLASLACERVDSHLSLRLMEPE